jgi:prolipoprotein diacylglyceryltransferase
MREGVLAGMTLRPRYRLFVHGGVIAGVLLAFALAPSAAALAVIPSTIAFAVGLGMATKRLLGFERFTFYHYQLAAIAFAAALAWVLRFPVRPALDLIAMTLVVAQASGRIGCWTAGCCHGRPSRFGTRYGDEQVERGLAPEWHGARLFPLQLVESLLLAVLACVVARNLVSAAPGTALVRYLAGYAAIRFPLELFRGEVRPHVAGVSYAQWIATATALIVMPRLGLVLVAAVCCIAIVRPRAWHRELALWLQSPRDTRIAAGLRLSGGRTGEIVHYTFSREALSERTARRIARSIRNIAHPAADAELVHGNGAFHLVVHEAAP